MGTILDQNLFNNDINKKNLDSFLMEFKKDPDNFIAFLGAGTSASLKGVPDLEELYTLLCDKYSSSKEGEAEWPSKFSKLYAQIEEKEEFDGELFEIIRPKASGSTSTHAEIATAFTCFVTTNYYDPIEHGFKQAQRLSRKKPSELTKYYFAIPNKEGAKFSLTYLHGNPLSGFCILRQKDYEYFYPSLYNRNDGVYVVENSLKNIFTGWSTIFLGCSLERHLKEFMQYFLSNVKKNGKSEMSDKGLKMHYWITSDSEIKKYLKDAPQDKVTEFENKYFENYSEINIKPIIYCGDHIFVENLCRTLAEMISTKDLSLAGDSYDPGQGDS